MKIIFFGTSDFGIPSLHQLFESNECLQAVVTAPFSKKGRGLKNNASPIYSYAKDLGIKNIFLPNDLNDPDFIAQLAGFGADLFVVIAFKILPEVIFTLPPLGTINVHASLLPRYRGAAPIQRAVEAGERESGVTVFKIMKQVDTGPILLQKSIPIGPDETAQHLYERLSNLAAVSLNESYHRLHSGQCLWISQNNSSATQAPKLQKEEACIKWSDSATTIYNKIRAFKSFIGTYAIFSGKRIGIESAVIVHKDSPNVQNPGTILSVTDSYFDVQCYQSVLRVDAVKPEGKKSMDVKAFLNGKTLTKGMFFS